MKSIADSKKRRGRPTTGIGNAMGLRLYPELEAGLDAFIAAQPDPKPSRPEAVRIALRDWLTGLGLLKHREDPEGANGR